MFKHVACLWNCVLFYVSFVCLHVCVYASKCKVHCGSVFEPGASGLPYYFTPPVCVPDVIGVLSVWRQNNKKKRSKYPSESLDYQWIIGWWGPNSSLEIQETVPDRCRPSLWLIFKCCFVSLTRGLGRLEMWPSVCVALFQKKTVYWPEDEED